MATWEFPGSEPIDLDLSVTSGTADITAAATDLITVSVYKNRRDAKSAADDPGASAAQSENADALAGEVRITFTDGRLTITEFEPRGLMWRSRELHYVIVVPTGSRCSVHAISTDVAIHGEVGSLDAKTASGHVSADDVRGRVQVTTISGDINVTALAGDANLHTASGTISVRHAGGDVAAKTVSGRVAIGSAARSVTINSASGRVRIDSVAEGRADVSTVSGNIDIKVAPRTGVYLDLSSLSGRVTSDLEASADDERTDLFVRARSVSGAVHLARAEHAEAAR